MISLKSVGQMSRMGGLVFVLLGAGARSTPASAQTLTTLSSFDGGNWSHPMYVSLIADANGDLFGTTEQGGASGNGTVFEIVKTSSGYASTPTTLVSFDNTNGALPFAGLIADANGNLFGTTLAGGASGLWHGVRDRQDLERLCKHTNHPGQLRQYQRRASGRPA